MNDDIKSIGAGNILQFGGSVCRVWWCFVILVAAAGAFVVKEDNSLLDPNRPHVSLAVVKVDNTAHGYANEKAWCKLLKGMKIIADPIGFIDESRTSIFEYAGKAVTNATLPNDWETQLKALMSTLVEHRCCHNDVKPEHILVDQTGHLRLIDYGWASVLGESLASNVRDDEPHLGEGYRCPSGFDDACSLKRSIASIRHDAVFPSYPVYSDGASFPCPTLAGALEVTILGSRIDLFGIDSWEMLWVHLGCDKMNEIVEGGGANISDLKAKLLRVGAPPKSSKGAQVKGSETKLFIAYPASQETCYFIRQEINAICGEGSSLSMESFWKRYSNDQQRAVLKASQSEVPVLSTTEKGIVVGGYQSFEAHRSAFGIEFEVGSKLEKFQTLGSLLGQWVKEGATFADIGCSAGLVSMMAASQSFTRVSAFDHDQEYIDVLTSAADKLGLGHIIEATRFDFGGCPNGELLHCSAVADVVFVGALIHWVFSATASFGSFEPIVRYLLSLTKGLLAIEWVTPEDPAISILKHTSMNQQIIREAYSTENFEAALRSSGAFIEQRFELDGPTRILYVLRKPSSGGSSSNEIVRTDARPSRFLPGSFFVCNYHGDATFRLWLKNIVTSAESKLGEIKWLDILTPMNNMYGKFPYGYPRQLRPQFLDLCKNQKLAPGWSSENCAENITEQVFMWFEDTCELKHMAGNFLHPDLLEPRDPNSTGGVQIAS